MISFCIDNIFGNQWILEIFEYSDSNAFLWISFIFLISCCHWMFQCWLTKKCTSVKHGWKLSNDISWNIICFIFIGRTNLDYPLFVLSCFHSDFIIAILVHLAKIKLKKYIFTSISRINLIEYILGTINLPCNKLNDFIRMCLGLIDTMSFLKHLQFDQQYPPH